MRRFSAIAQQGAFADSSSNWRKPLERTAGDQFVESRPRDDISKKTKLDFSLRA